MIIRSYAGVIVIILALSFSVLAQSSIFTYQGKLNDGAIGANGTYQMQFLLFDSPSGPTQIGSTFTNNLVSVTSGMFTVQLDFSPATPFATGADRWLEIAVKRPADAAFTTLAPRQQITTAPFAVRSSLASSATTALNVTGVVAIANGGTGSATQNFVDLSTNQTIDGTKTFTSPISGNGSQLTNIDGANITSNTINSSALAADTFPNNQNLSRLGQRRWDLLGQRVNAGTGPFGVAFDGANIWVTNRVSNNVTKLRTSDGAIQGTFAVGSGPCGVAFDGANIWVANRASNNVTKLRATDGAVQGTFAVGSGPNGVAFDGANIWVANSGSSNVTKLRATDGVVQGTFPIPFDPTGVEFDGVNIWVAAPASNNVTKLRASDGAIQGTIAVGTGPNALAFDGANIWVSNFSSNNVTKLRASDGAIQGTFAVGSAPVGVAFDGTNICVSNSNSGSVTKLRASDGALQVTFEVGTNPYGIAFDGANMWVAGYGSNNVTKVPVFP